MFKKAFTLAEVLITLTVIGIVAALTLPSLLTDANDADVVPRLNKVHSALAQANRSLLYDNGVDRMSETGFFGTNDATHIDTNNYMEKLSDYLKFSGSYSKADGVEFEDVEALHLDLKFYMLPDGASVAFHSSVIYNEIDTSNKPHLVEVGTYVIDVNGRTQPNALNKDIFYLKARDDGSAIKDN